MISSLNLFIPLLFLLISCFTLIEPNSSSSSKPRPLCHDDERAALLQFKQSFSIDNPNASYDDSAYRKTASWTIKDGCCSWDGVQCDDHTGYVTGLDLSSSFLYGSINSSSSLFRLLRLQYLNLADNNFNSSPIPSTLAHLSDLTYLNLSQSGFSGEIPTKISQLSKLASLDLSGGTNILLIPEKSGQKSLVQNLLKELHLSWMNISSTVPDVLANMSSLTSLILSYCELVGEFPTPIFQLPNLRSLSVSGNPYLTGYLPEFNKTSPLTHLSVAYTGFSGELPDSIGNLNSLNELSISGNFSGSVPTSLGLARCNLTEFPSFLRHQHKLQWLDLSGNRIQGDIPKWMWNVSKESMTTMSFYNNCLTGFDQPPLVLPWTRLIYLDLGSNMLRGSLPLPPPSISYFFVSNNSLTGEISPFICNLTSFLNLDLSNNNLSGTLPECLGNLSKYLSLMNLQENNFHGSIPQTFTNQCKLTMIDVTQNRLRGRLPRSLANCKMLQALFLGDNQFNDTFPYWLGSLPSLQVLIMQSNEFHGAIRSPEVSLVFPKLRVIELSNNSFTGKLPSEYLKIWNAMKASDVKPFTYLHWYSMTIIKAGIKTHYTRIPENLKSHRPLKQHIPRRYSKILWKSRRTSYPEPFPQLSYWSHPIMLREPKGALFTGPFSQQALRRDPSATNWAIISSKVRCLA